MAVCALMGDVVDGADVDPRNGGQETFEGLQAAGMWPRSYGRQETPSGGFHDLIAALGVGTRTGSRLGLDVKGGYRDGRPRLPVPRADRTQVEGARRGVRPYRWTVEPDLTDLVGDGLIDESGHGMAEMIERSRSSPPPKVPPSTRRHRWQPPTHTRDPFR